MLLLPIDTDQSLPHGQVQSQANAETDFAYDQDMWIQIGVKRPTIQSITQIVCFYFLKLWDIFNLFKHIAQIYILVINF